MLAFAIQNGSYRHRLAVIESLAKMNDAVIPMLRSVLSDKVPSVAYAATEALRQRSLPSEIEAEIEKTLAYWKEHEAASRKAWAKNKWNQVVEIPFDKANLKRFAQFKQKVLRQMNKGQFYG